MTSPNSNPSRCLEYSDPRCSFYARDRSERFLEAFEVSVTGSERSGSTSFPDAATIHLFGQKTRFCQLISLKEFVADLYQDS